MGGGIENKEGRTGSGIETREKERHMGSGREIIDIRGVE